MSTSFAKYPISGASQTLFHQLASDHLRPSRETSTSKHGALNLFPCLVLLFVSRDVPSTVLFHVCNVIHSPRSAPWNKRFI
uniref:Uncharacterized protein n=1 Tax=Rhizophora mucronata TaxID=61149 RepID=A0A2P2NK72_RHIMU